MYPIRTFLIPAEFRQPALQIVQLKGKTPETITVFRLCNIAIESARKRLEVDAKVSLSTVFSDVRLVSIGRNSNISFCVQCMTVGETASNVLFENITTDNCVEPVFRGV
jgi:hypothetical protein